MILPHIRLQTSMMVSWCLGGAGGSHRRMHMKLQIRKRALSWMSIPKSVGNALHHKRALLIVRHEL